MQYSNIVIDDDEIDHKNKMKQIKKINSLLVLAAAFHYHNFYADRYPILRGSLLNPRTETTRG